MDIELLEKANDVQKKIREVRDIIYNLQYKKENTARTAEEFERKNTPTSKFFLFSIKLRNKETKENKDIKSASIVIFNNISPYGYEFECEEELINIIEEYFQKKLEKLNREFEELGTVEKHSSVNVN